MSINKEFYSSTISGVELKVKFAFRKIFFTKQYKDKDDYVFYDIGVLANIGWEEIVPTNPKYSFNMIKAMDISSGMLIVQGDMIFKNFHEESLAAIKEEILKGINNEKNKIEFPLIEDNPFVTLEDENEDYKFSTTSDGNRISWAQMPLFDLLLISSADDGKGRKEAKIKTIRDIKISSTGFAESVESLEMNSMTSFICVGGVSGWEAYKVE